MTIDVSDAELEFGNILVMKESSKLKVADIKRLTRATKVKRIKPNGVDDAAVNTLYRNIQFACTELKMYGDWFSFVKLYQMEGEIASTMLSLQTSDFLAATCMTATNYKSLHNAVTIRMRVNPLKAMLTHLISENQKLLDLLAHKKDHKSHLAKAGKTLRKIDADYCSALSTECKEMMANVMKTVW